jgi:hypothetical protein
MLDHGVRARKYQPFMAVLEANQEGRATGLSSDLDDFAAAIRLSDVVRFHHQRLAHFGLHADLPRKVTVPACTTMSEQGRDL